MAHVFETSSIRGLSIRNRFVRSATWEGMANPDGTCTKKLIDLMIQLAKGGVGLIISGNTGVSPEGQAGPWHLLRSREKACFYRFLCLTFLPPREEAMHMLSSSLGDLKSVDL